MSKAFKLLIICAASLVIAAFVAILFTAKPAEPIPAGGGKAGGSLMQFQ